MARYQLIDSGSSHLFEELASGLHRVLNASATAFESNSLLKLQRFSMHARYLWSSAPTFTIWRGLGSIKDEEPRFTNYERWITCRPGLLLCGQRSIDVVGTANFVVKPRWFGWQTELSIEQSAKRQILCREWNHGSILQGIDVAPDPWFEQEDDYLWTLEMAFRLSQQFADARAESRLGPAVVPITSWPQAR